MREQAVRLLFLGITPSPTVADYRREKLAGGRRYRGRLYRESDGLQIENVALRGSQRPWLIA